MYIFQFRLVFHRRTILQLLQQFLLAFRIGNHFGQGLILIVTNVTQHIVGGLVLGGCVRIQSTEAPKINILQIHRRIVGRDCGGSTRVANSIFGFGDFVRGCRGGGIPFLLGRYGLSL